MATTFTIPRRTLLAVLLLVAALAVITFVALRLPKAVITVAPATHERTISQEITLSATATEPDFVRFILPAKLIEKEITESMAVKRAGQEPTEDFARGQVKLINQQEEEQRLLPKTHLRHEPSGVFFLTDAAAVIPPKGESTVTVTAKEKGASGNVAAGKFLVDKLPASVQQVVFGESATRFDGGLSVEQPLTEAEINDAKEKVKQAALERANGELTAQAGGATTSSELVTLETLEDTVSAQPGSKTTEFTVQTKVKARGFFPDHNDLLSLTLLALRSAPQPDEEFVEYKPESFKTSIIRSDFTRGEARVKGSLTGLFAGKTGPTAFSAENLAGRSEEEVKEYFKQFPTVGDVSVNFSPFWVKSVPSRPEATEIVIKAGN